MKKKTAKKSAPALGCVTLKYHFPHASTVFIAGTFNGWDANGTSLRPLGDGFWSVDLNLASGRYEFRLIVDGIWIDAPDATEAVENPFGGRNAVLTLKPEKG
jgi:1,4-alpha-glucan branching enzyme